MCGTHPVQDEEEDEEERYAELTLFKMKRKTRKTKMCLVNLETRLQRRFMLSSSTHQLSENRD
jgi:hypothetical protein